MGSNYLGPPPSTPPHTPPHLIRGVPRHLESKLQDKQRTTCIAVTPAHSDPGKHVFVNHFDGDKICHNKDGSQ